MKVSIVFIGLLIFGVVKALLDWRVEQIKVNNGEMYCHLKMGKVYEWIMTFIIIAMFLLFMIDCYQIYELIYDDIMVILSGVAILMLKEFSKSSDEIGFCTKNKLIITMILFIVVEWIFYYYNLGKSPYRGLLEGLFVWWISVLVEEKIK